MSETVMEAEWFIGIMRDDPPDELGKRGSTLDLAVQITREEHRALREAEKVIREALGGLLFRLVFANHCALQDHEARMLELLTRRDLRGFLWIPDHHIEMTFALANWLTSVRWLLDHSLARLHDEPEKLKRVRAAMSREFDNHFAYRLAYKLRDYATHCGLPPISVHVSSKAVGADGREDALSLQLVPTDLLNAWDGWGTHVKKDLEERTDSIDLVTLTDIAMESIERVMSAILMEDVPEHQNAARLMLQAVDRLPEDALESDVVPVLFAAMIEDGVIRNLNPTPLPVAEAREILNPRGDLQA